MNTRNTRGLAVLVPLAVLLMLVMLTTWLNRTIELSLPAAPRALTHDPDYTAKNFTVVKLSDLGETQYSLAAAELLHYPDDDSSHLARPVFKEVQPGQPEVRVTASRGIVTSQLEEVRLYDNVELFRAGDKKAQSYQDSQDMTLNTSFLRVRPDEDHADTPERVVMHNGASVLVGTGMDFDNRYRKVKLHSKVTGTYIQAPKKN